MGWARANLLYDTITSPPEPGSLKEAVCVLVQKYRADQKYFLAAATLSEGAAQKDDMFNRFRSALFPYVEKTDEDWRSRMKAMLDRFYMQGPIAIKAEEDA